MLLDNHDTDRKTDGDPADSESQSTQNHGGRIVSDMPGPAALDALVIELKGLYERRAEGHAIVEAANRDLAQLGKRLVEVLAQLGLTQEVVRHAYWALPDSY